MIQNFLKPIFGMKFVFSYATLATPFLVGTLFFLIKTRERQQN